MSSSLSLSLSLGDPQSFFLLRERQRERGTNRRFIDKHMPQNTVCAHTGGCNGIRDILCVRYTHSHERCPKLPLGRSEFRALFSSALNFSLYFRPFPVGFPKVTVTPVLDCALSAHYTCVPPSLSPPLAGQHPRDTERQQCHHQCLHVVHWGRFIKAFKL